jgi:hypothetical protein
MKLVFLALLFAVEVKEFILIDTEKTTKSCSAQYSINWSCF